MAWIGSLERRRRDVVAAPPDLDLRVAVLRRRLGLVQALQGAVVTLIETPASLDGNPQKVELVERNPAGAKGALQDRRVGNVEDVALGLQQLARGGRFLAAFVTQVDVGPPGEPVLFVPGAFAVPQEDYLVHATYLSCLMALRPAYFAAAPSSLSILRSWLYLAVRSARLAEPVLIWPAHVATARSAIVVSSVSPERWEITLAYPACRAISTAASVSETVPIWFSFTSSALPIFFSMPCFRIAGFVTNTSSPTSCTREPIAAVRRCQPGQSPSASPSSIEMIGYCRVQSS